MADDANIMWARYSDEIASVQNIYSGAWPQLVSQIQSAHERGAKAINQISLLFLSGWVALTVANKVPFASPCVTFLVALACLLHLVVIFLVLWVDWRVIREGTRLTENTATSFGETIRRLRMQRYYQTLLLQPNTDELLKQGILNGINEESQKEQAASLESVRLADDARRTRDRSLSIGLKSILLFGFSIFFSTAVMIILVAANPPVH